MSQIIDITEFRRKQDSIEENPPSPVDFEERLNKIRSSLEKINRLMADLRETNRHGDVELGR
jgi:hypothetical protein